MANDLNNGAEKLTGRIIDDARAEAAKTAEAAQAEIAKIKELAGRSVQEVNDEFEELAKKTAAGILERSRTNAQLDSRKYALTAKRKVIDGAFDGALAGLGELNEAKRNEFFAAMAVSNAYGGEALAPAPADEARAKALLPKINADLAAAGKAALTLAPAAKSIGGGFLLIGAGYEMNCSFEALLRDLREAEESGVAKILFG